MTSTSVMAPPKPPEAWHLQPWITPWTIGILLVIVIVLGWSAHRVELDKASRQIGELAVATVGLKESSEIGGGMGRFISGMVPLAISEVTEVGRIEYFNPDELPWFSRIETRTQMQPQYNTSTMTLEEVAVTSTVLIEPAGYLLRVAGLMIKTIEMAIWATILAVTVAAPLGFLGARNLSPHPSITAAARAVSSFLRAMPELVLAMVLVLGFGFGPVPGILALGLHSAGFFGKFFADDAENADRGPQEALRAAGANRLTVLRYAVIPQVWPQYLAYIQYVLERNVRTATIIGIVGAGGIGVELKGRFEMFHYQHVATILLAIFITVVALEHLAGRLRKKVM